MLALASPASLKGVLSPRRGGARCSRPGCDASTSRPTSCRSPTAARERPTVLHARARRRVAHGDGLRSARPAGHGALARAARRHGGRRLGRGGRPAAARAPTSATRCARSTRGLGELLLAVARRPAARAARRRRRHGDRRRRRRDARGRRRLAARCADARRRATCAIRCSASAAPRASSARRRARTPEAVEELEAAPRGDSTSSRRTASCRAPARAAASARPSRRSAASCATAPSSCSTDRLRRARARADLVVTGEGTVDATTLEGKAPGAVVRRVRAARRALRAVRRRRARRHRGARALGSTRRWPARISCSSARS